MLRQTKPRNARSKRALVAREPKAVENPRTSLVLRGGRCSRAVQDLLADLHALHKPHAKKFTKRNAAVRPFEDAASLEFFADKNDASLLLFGSSQKKRPHAVTWIRTFGHRVLDMLELHLDPASFRAMASFRARKFAVGLRPMLLFAGAAFESPVPDEYTLAKSLFVDFFKGEPADKIDVEGLQHIVSFVVGDEKRGGAAAAAAAADGGAVDGDGGGGNGSGSLDGSQAKPAIHMRVYLIRTKRSGQKLPRVEVEEIGPRVDFRVGRVRHADSDMLKQAMKTPRGLEERTKKNVTTDTMGDKIGRVHLGKQDLGGLQTRKMKGLKRSRFEDNDDDVINDADEDAKRPKQ